METTKMNLKGELSRDRKVAQRCVFPRMRARFPAKTGQQFPQKAGKVSQIIRARNPAECGQRFLEYPGSNPMNSSVPVDLKNIVFG